MRSMADTVKTLRQDLDMDVIENAIIRAMVNGASTAEFTLTDDIGGQSANKIHRMGVEIVRNAGYIITKPEFGKITVSGWNQE